MDAIETAAGFVPNFPGKQQVLAQAQQAIRSPKAKSLVAFTGKPIAYDIKQDYQPKGTKKEEKTFLGKAWHFIRRYIFTVGNAIGLGGILASIGLNFYSKANPEGNKLLQTFSFVPKLITFAGIGISAYANFFTNTTADHYVGFDQRLAAAGLNIIDEVGESLSDEELAKIVDKSKPEVSPLRYNKEETKKIFLRVNNPQSPAKLFLTGIAGTGKTEGIKLVTGRIIDYEAIRPLSEGEKRKKVQVLRLDCTKVRNHILGIKNDDDFFSGLASMAGIDMSGRKSTPELCLAVLNGLAEKFKKAGDDVRLIVHLNEVNELWNLAKIDGKYDPEYSEKIANTLANLIDSNLNKYDVLMTSNLSVQQLLGLEENFGNNEQKLKESHFAGVYRRLTEMAVDIREPEILTKANILAVYLRKLPQEKLKYLDRILKEKIEESIEEKDENKLRDYLYGEIEERFKEACKDPELIPNIDGLYKLREDLLLKIRFDKSTGSTIEKTVDNLITHYSSSAQVKPSDKITIDELIDQICANSYALTQADVDKASQVINPRIDECKKAIKDSERHDREAHAFEGENEKELRILLGMEKDKLSKALEDKTVRAFVEKAIINNSELCRQLRTKFFSLYS